MIIRLAISDPSVTLTPHDKHAIGHFKYHPLLGI